MTGSSSGEGGPSASALVAGMLLILTNQRDRALARVSELEQRMAEMSKTISEMDKEISNPQGRPQ